jgi:hypothetical protein
MIIAIIMQVGWLNSPFKHIINVHMDQRIVVAGKGSLVDLNNIDFIVIGTFDYKLTTNKLAITQESNTKLHLDLTMLSSHLMHSLFAIN